MALVVCVCHATLGSSAAVAVQVNELCHSFIPLTSTCLPVTCNPLHHATPLPAECPGSQAVPAACTGSLQRPLWRLRDSCGPAAPQVGPERDAAASSGRWGEPFLKESQR